MFTDMKYVDLWYLKTSFSSFRGINELEASFVECLPIPLLIPQELNPPTQY